MRKVIAAAFVSLDGVMQAPGGPEEDPSGGFAHGGWTVTYWDEAMSQAMGETFSRPYELLLGRKTYDIFAAHWPHAEDSPDATIAKQFNAVRKYVATHATGLLTWNNSVALHDAAKDVARLKQQDGPDLLIQGSSNLIQSLLEHDLIDEFRLLIFPLVLGRGKKLFGESARPGALALADSKVSSTGVIISSYRRAGQIRTGSFALDPPTAEEIARRGQN